MDVRGRGEGSITVEASGELEINGHSSIDIRSTADNAPATAEVLLTAGKSVVINGDVEAEARGKFVNRAHILIKAGKDAAFGYDATVNGNLDAWAHTAAHGTSDALIEVYASGNIKLNGEDPHARAGEGSGRANVQSNTSIREEIYREKKGNTYIAEIKIEAESKAPPEPKPEPEPKKTGGPRPMAMRSRAPEGR